MRVLVLPAQNKELILHRAIYKYGIGLIEAVTYYSPVSAKRIVELEEILKDCKAGKVMFQHFLTLQNLKNIRQTLHGKQKFGL